MTGTCSVITKIHLCISSAVYENEPTLQAPRVLVPVWAPCDLACADTYCEQRPHLGASSYLLTHVCRFTGRL